MTPLVDTSVFCGHWPFRQLAQTEFEGLKVHLKQHGVTQAWVAAVESVLLPDPMEGNEPLLTSVSADPFFVPFAVIDVSLATYLDDAAACLKNWRCGGFKLLPNYHSFPVNDARVTKLLEMAAAENVPVSFQLRMVDERAHHPLMKVPGVPAADVAALAAAHPKNRFLACGAYHAELKHLQSAAKNLWVELSSVESGESLVNALKIVSGERIVFGSHSPFYYFEAVAEKLNVGSDVSPETLRRVRELNSAELLGQA